MVPFITYCRKVLNMGGLMVTPPTDRTVMGSRFHVDDCIEELVSSNIFPLQSTAKSMYSQKKYDRNDTPFVCSTAKCFLTSLPVSYNEWFNILNSMFINVCTHFYVKTPTTRKD